MFGHSVTPRHLTATVPYVRHTLAMPDACLRFCKQRQSNLFFNTAIVATVERSDIFLEPSGNYMYHLLPIQLLRILPTNCIYVFCMILRINSDYFLKQR
jgi:hypothetical protein